jgi:predicted PurR-regulated permease PerM
MIGGPFVFGVVGLLLGPLILAYVLLVIELYRKRDGEDIIFKKVEEPPKN